MKTLLLTLSLLSLALAAAPVNSGGSKSQKCLEEFVGLTQDWFKALVSGSGEKVGSLLQASATWGKVCRNFSAMELEPSAEANVKVQGLYNCYKTIRSIPERISKLTADLLAMDQVALTVDAYLIYQTVESLLLDCGL